MAPATPSEDGGGRQFVDILLVDDMENVAKKFRAAIPPHLSISSCVSAQAALNVCRERIFRVILIDNEIPDVDSSVLMNQLRVLQPHAAFLALALRSVNKVQNEMKELGFDDVLFKPFTAEAIDDLLLRYFDNQDVVTKSENVLKVAAFKGRENRLPGYFVQISTVATKSVDDIAAACFAEVILDLSNLPAAGDKPTRLVLDLSERAKKVGVELRVVASGDVGKALAQYSDTASMHLFPSVAEAQGGSAA
jgi:CheY-like chemotaxis protein